MIRLKIDMARGSHGIMRFMIDVKYQNKGYRTRPWRKPLSISGRFPREAGGLHILCPEMEARRLYRKFGFIEIGFNEEAQETVARLEL